MVDKNQNPGSTARPLGPYGCGYGRGRGRSFSGPLFLIAIGVLFLLVNMHIISGPRVGYWFAHYWPVILIIVGITRLVEYIFAQHGGYAAPRMGGGIVVLLIFLCLFGFAAMHTANVNWAALNDDFDQESNPFFRAFHNTYSYQDQIEQAFIPGSSLTVVCDRGAIKVLASADEKIRVAIHKKVFAGSESDGKSVNQRTMPQITTNGNVIRIDAQRHGDDQFVSDLEIQLPRKASVDLTTARGDIHVNGRDGEVKANTSRGSVSILDINGLAEVRLRRGDFEAQNINGDVSLEGRIDDSNISDVKGTLTLSGDFFGDMKLSKVGKTVRFKSSRTDLEFARLDGDLDLSSGDVRASSVVGPLRLTTRSKDIHLDSVSGDVNIENSNAQIELHPLSPLGKIDVSNKRGSINLYVPSGAGFELDARANHGEIENDFNDSTTQNNYAGTSKSYGTVGKGGPRVNLTTDRGSIEIRKS